MPPALVQAADLLRYSNYTVALTGAGVSTPSGIPDFRSASSGLWTHFDPMAVASLWAFHDHPDDFYRWLRPLLQKMHVARPNMAHRVLAAMEDAGCLSALITQNIDSLHQQAGSKHVLEVHGHARTVTCLECSDVSASDAAVAQVLMGGTVPRCTCGGLLKPDVILFGEPLPHETLAASQQEALNCEVMLVVGTSLEVMPAADLPLLSKRRGARLIFINRTRTALDEHADVVINADVVGALRQLWQMITR